MSAKRIRGKNFSEQEEHVLIDLVLLKKDILQDKKKDAATWRRKAETWEQLAAEFRAQTGTDRTCAALREKYDNMKKNSRNKYRGVKNWDHERELSVAGSSWCSRSSMTDNNEGHIGNTTTTPLENQFDSDGNFQLINVAKEENPSISSKNSDSSQLLQNIDDIDDPEVSILEASQRWKAKRLRECGSPTLPQINRSPRTEKEQVELFKLQQQYYRDQNSRAAEQHKYEVEKQIVELQTARLKNQLLEMEIEVKREELAKIKQTNLS